MTASPPTILALLASLSVAVCAGGGAAAAQDAPKPKSNAQIDAGEPRAATSPAAAAAAADAQSPATAPAATAPAAVAPPATADGGKGAAAAKKPASKGPGAPKPGATDRVDLGTATVTGDREQPKVMYVVPWKSADIGELSGKPMNSLIDEALAPVDRAEFKREVVYYDVMKADRSRAAAPAAPAAQGEK